MCRKTVLGLVRHLTNHLDDVPYACDTAMGRKKRYEWDRELPLGWDLCARLLSDLPLSAERLLRLCSHVN